MVKPAKFQAANLLHFIVYILSSEADNRYFYDYMKQSELVKGYRRCKNKKKVFQGNKGSRVKIVFYN